MERQRTIFPLYCLYCITINYLLKQFDTTTVKRSKIQKIDLNREYPCPCQRKGKLLPIILTEAMGCDRCQQIFVLTENGQVIEQLSSTYPYKRSWRWTGKRWLSIYTPWQEKYLPLTVVIIIILLIVWLSLAFRSTGSVNIILWTIIALMLALLPAIMVWLAYRR